MLSRRRFLHSSLLATAGAALLPRDPAAQSVPLTFDLHTHPGAFFNHGKPGYVADSFAGTVRGNADGSIGRTQPQTGDGPPTLATGEYLGQFNLGSTVIVLGGRGLFQWRTGLAPGDRVRVGERLGSLASPGPP